MFFVLHGALKLPAQFLPKIPPRIVKGKPTAMRNNNTSWDKIFQRGGRVQRKSVSQPAIWASCSSHVLAHKSFQLAPKPFLINRIDYHPSVIWISPKNCTCPSGKLRTKITSPIAKSTSPGLSDTTFFARCKKLATVLEIFRSVISYVLKLTYEPYQHQQYYGGVWQSLSWLIIPGDWVYNAPYHKERYYNNRRHQNRC